MKAVILAGGLGTRLSEETHVRPKPMVEVGGYPILWHILKIYAAHGIHDFVICAGYKGYVIKEYFANYCLHSSDVTFHLAEGRIETHDSRSEDWSVTVLDTGVSTNTAGRLLCARKFLQDETFCLTYGDGVGAINIRESIEQHCRMGKLATLTTVSPPARFGKVETDNSGCVASFEEKPSGEGGRINGGFFVLNPQIMELITDYDQSFEHDTLPLLAERGELAAYRHDGFWRPMDTLRDKRHLNELWASGQAPWKIWE